MSVVAEGVVGGLQRATRVRHRVVGFAAVLAAITYIDRVCIASLAPFIMEDLSLSSGQMSLVFSSFTLAYMLFEIPTAWWADRIGTHRVLTRIVIWWSSFTLATAAAFNYSSLLVMRFLFGAGEAGAWPTVARTFRQWIPYQERGRAQGTFFIGAHIGGGLTPILVAVLVGYFSWRSVLLILGSLGFVWAFFWFRWFCDEPADHPDVNERELELIEENRTEEASHSVGWQYWKQLFASRNMWALCFMYIPNAFGFYFCISWLPRYLSEEHGLSTMWLAFFAGLPLVLSVLADVVGGVMTDWAVGYAGPRLGRIGVGFAAYAIAGIVMLCAAVTTNPMLAGFLVAFATAASMALLATAWATCQDVGGNHTGVVSATMNTAGQLGGVASPILINLLVERFNDWGLAISMIGILFLFGAVCWLFIDPRVKVFSDASPS